MDRQPIDNAIVRSFIVRIYRTSPDRSENILGLIEEVGKEGTDLFKSIEDLWKILSRTMGI